MGFVRLSGKNPRQIAFFGALLAVSAFCLLAPAPAEAELSEEARAAIHHQRGARALREGDQLKAIEWLDKAIALEPDRVESLALKARALLEAGRVAESEEVTELLKNLRPDDYDVTFLLAVTAYRQQDWIGAKRYFEEAHEQNPRDPRVHLYLGRTYQELGQDTLAEEALREAAELDPEFRAPAAYRMGILHLQRSESKEAKLRFQEVKELDPGSKLAGSAELYLKLMAANEPKRISYWIKLGTAWDRNMTLAGGGDFVASSGEAGYRASLEVGLNARLFKWKDVTVRSGFSTYVSRHSHLHDFDIQQARPWLMATYQPVEWLAFDTRFTYEQVARDYNNFKEAYFVSPAIRFIPKPGWVTRAFGDYENRDYIRAFDVIVSRDRDGWVGTLGIDQYVPLPNPFADGVAYFRFGWRWRHEDASGDHFDSQSHKPLATLVFALPWGMNISLDASFERRAFRKPSVFESVKEILAVTGNPGADFSLLPAFAAQPAQCRFSPPVEDLSRCASNNRLDRIIQARVRLRKSIGKNWTVETYYRWVEWGSNTEEFDFDRHIVGLAATFRR